MDANTKRIRKKIPRVRFASYVYIIILGLNTPVPAWPFWKILMCALALFKKEM